MNNWKIISTKSTKKLWLAECGCGFQKYITKHQATNGKSCQNCRWNDKKLAINSKYGDWTIIDEASLRSNKSYYSCRCVCGKIKSISSNDLKSGKSTKCLNCSRKARIYKYPKEIDSNTKTYRIWRSLFERCYDAKRKDFEYYGGRGIIVCDRWKNYTTFVEDMGPQPEGMQLDRLNPNGNYEPANCRWVTLKENMKNRRMCSKNREQFKLILRKKICKPCKSKLVENKKWGINENN